MASEHYNRLAIHYSACNEHYYQCQDCEQQFRWLRVFGKCSEHFVNLKKCMQEQRSIQREANYRKSKEKQERLKQRLASNKFSYTDYFPDRV